MKKKHLLALVIAALAAVLSCSARAQAPLQDPSARIREAMKNAAELKSLGFTESFKSQIVMNGNTRESNLKGELVLRGKDSLSAHFTVDRREVRLVSNGTTHNLYVIGSKTYESTEMPIPRPQLMVTVASDALRAPGFWLANFLDNKPDLLDSAGNIERKGEQNIDGTDCEGYSLTYPGFDIVTWLTRSDPPVLRRVEADLKKALQSQAQDSGITAATVQADVTDWKPNVETQDSQFVFTPPDGVEKAKEEKPEVSLEGKAAEDFELPLLDGGTVKLSELKGKTVVLDFWATWCGPCRKAMPIVEKVTEEFADKGVVLYTVNLQEDAETIKAFLQATNLKPKVALDKEGKVGSAYGAPPIPSIILVGTDGVVRKVYRGISPQFEDEFRSVLSGIGKGAAPEK